MIRWLVPEAWTGWTRAWELDVHTALREAGVRYVVGVDEAGRGPLAGPVTVAAVLFDLEEESSWHDVGDSKAIKPEQRAVLEARILSAFPAAVLHVDEAEIAERNILGATLHGMTQAVLALLASTPAAADAPILVDGPRLPPVLKEHAIALVKGDARSRAVGAASILAKEARDRLMVEADARYPGYGFARHKGYGTAAHLAALRTLGPTPLHRRGFAPVEAAILASKP